MHSFLLLCNDMKKILLVLFLFVSLQSNCLAQTGLTFVYINGSNNNDIKMKNWYENGVKKLHPCLKKEFETSKLSQKYFLRKGEYYINQAPAIFFWGDKSYKDLSFVEEGLSMSKGFSPWLAFQVRSMITHYLHDAIWIQKYPHMLPVLDDLHQMIKFQAQKGNEVVLYGYSAGSFITYEYLLTREPYINVVDFFNNVKVPQADREYVAQHPMRDTCMRALGEDLAVFSAAGHIVPNDDEETFKKDYMHLDELTDKYCAPRHSIKGIVNFASPLVLFYSDLSDPNYDLTYYNRLLFKYIIENDMFWLTVNYREDPLGFPGGKNLSIEEIENIAKLNIEPHRGFIYDQSNTKGLSMVFTAHTSYWSTRNRFSKAVVKAFVDGYSYHYDDNFKPKNVEKFEKKMHFTP